MMKPCNAGQLLFDLGHCIDDKRVQAKGPQQSICCTKSYHGLRDFVRVDEALQRLVFALWPRLLEVRAVGLLLCSLSVTALLQSVPPASDQLHCCVFTTLLQSVLPAVDQLHFCVC